MMHTALARKYRPTRFADLVGQGHVAAGLTGAVVKNRVAHAYLLTGPRGVGKTSAARILAMALNCERRPPEQGEPCGSCDSCRRIWAGSANLDVVEIDAASNRGVDDARDLRERAMYAASGPDRSKVYIVDEAHMLTREAWNALLKILEEPPPRVVFVFATTEPQKIANTAAPVLSRMQRFDFHRLNAGTIRARLAEVAAQEKLAVDDDALVLIARVAAGGMRDALSVLDQIVAFGEGTVTAGRVRESLGLIGDELYAELLDLIASGNAAGVFPFIARVVDAGADLEEFVNGAGEALRAVLLRVLGGEPEGLTEALREAVDRHAGAFREGDLLRMLKLLRDCETVIRRSPNARLYTEALVLQWTLLDRTVDLAELLGGGRPQGEGRTATSAPPDQAVRRSGGQPSESSPAATVSNRAPAVAARPPVRPPAPSAAGPSAPERAARPPVRAPAAAPSGPVTLDSIMAAWPTVKEAVGRRSRMLQEALGEAALVALQGDTLEIQVAEGSVHRQGLERQRKVVEEVLGEMFGQRLHLTFGAGAARAPVVASESTPRRLDPQGEKQERLKGYRAHDATLDAVAEALDLELLE